jgi:hypothetical protein
MSFLACILSFSSSNLRWDSRYPRGAQIFQISRAQLKIPGARRRHWGPTYISWHDTKFSGPGYLVSWACASLWYRDLELCFSSVWPCQILGWCAPTSPFAVLTQLIIQQTSALSCYNHEGDKSLTIYEAKTISVTKYNDDSRWLSELGPWTVELVSQTFSQSLSQSFSQSVSQSFSQSASPSVSQPVIQSVIQSASPSVTQPVIQSVSQPDLQSVRQPVFQSVNQPVFQSNSQSFSQSVSPSASHLVLQSVSPSVSQSFSQSVSLSVSQSFSQSASNSVSQTASPSVSQSVSPSVSHSVS